ncbi:hypothetical protein [Escherichia coli]|uniref:hypothetical protein n=1 Tax=Escherichia coli TaxID=562 RepID=UPI003CC915C9
MSSCAGSGDHLFGNTAGDATCARSGWRPVKSSPRPATAPVEGVELFAERPSSANRCSGWLTSGAFKRAL